MATENEAQATAAVALRDLASGMYTVGGAATVADRSLIPVKYVLRSIDTLEKDRAQLEAGATALQQIAKVFEKIGITRPAGKVANVVAGRVKDNLDDIEKSIERLEESGDKIARAVEKASDILGKIGNVTETLGIAADVYSRKLAVADQNLADASQLFDTGIPYFGADDDLTMGAIKLQVARAAEKNQAAANDITKVTGFVNDLTDNIEGISNLTDYPGFNPIEVVIDLLRDVADKLSPLFSPLSAVYDKIGPLLDAMGSFFSIFLGPFEWALEAVLDRTGINDVLRDAADEILSFLPDLGILDGLAARWEREFLADLEAYIADRVVAPFAEIEDLLASPTFPDILGLATEGDDFLTGSLRDSGPRVVDALGGNDIVVGGAFNDTLRGGEGLDILIGGGGDDLLDGGANEDLGPDIAQYSGNLTDYTLVSVLVDGKASGVWYVADYRDDVSVAGNDDKVSSGTDMLINVEAIFFADTVLDLRLIDTFIQTRTRDGEFARVTPDSSTLPEIAGQPQITAFDGVDFIFGGEGLDELITGGGNDQLTSGSNGPRTGDELNALGDYLEGGTGNDIYVFGPTSARFDLVLDEGGIDTADYKNSVIGLNVFLGETENELFYRPTSITIDASPEGRVVAGNRYPVGQLSGIENIDGTDFADVFYGTNEINKINGGAGNDQIRGLGGNDILLGGNGNDTLIGDGGDDLLSGGAGANTYVGGLGDDTISDISSSFSTVKYSAVAETSKYNQSVDFVDFLTTGFGTFDPLDMPGGIVILPTDRPGEQQVSKYATSVLAGDRYGVDELLGVELIVASVGDDVIVTSRDINQTIFANDGNDDLRSGLGETQNTFYAGPGDDIFVSELEAEDTFFGGAGSDTVRVWDNNTIDGDLLFGDDNRRDPLDGTDLLDFSQSEFSWHIYMNPIAPNGEVAGKAPITSFDIDNPRFIQPTLGVDGVVEKLPGVTVPGEVYPGVLNQLKNPDPNTPDLGGRADNVGEFEHIIGSETRDIISGGNADSGMRVEALGGNDVLYAAQRFAATLEGGAGDDVLGTYNHTYGSDEVERFFDEDKITEMSGGLGEDTFVGGDFREEIDGGAGRDLLTYEVSSSGVTVDLTDLLLDRGYATGDVLAGGIEDVTGSESDDLLRGDGEANELVGWRGDDTLRGEGGADEIYGNDGADELFGGDGNDLLHGGNGGDLLDGGEGSDAASWNLYQSDPKGGVDRLTNDLTGILADLETGRAGEDTLVSIENLVGGVGADSLFGNGEANLLAGNLGDDELDGRGGADILTGGAGDDTLTGGDGNDALIGGAGTNVLDGGDGVDAIDYGVLAYGIDVVMAGVGRRADETTGEVTSFTPVDFYVWTDSLTTTQGPTGLETDTIQTGTDETRFTYQIFDQGTDDPSDDTRREEDPITPERIWQLDALFADEPSDLDPVRFLPDDGLLPEQEVTALERFEAATDRFSNIERIIGGQGDDTFIGNTEDTFFYGGLGADTIDGGQGTDTASYQFSEEAVSIDLTAGTVTGGDATGDVLVGIENLDGSDHGDVLTGDGAGNHLRGLGGDDVLAAGAGDDSLEGGEGTDTAVFAVDSADVTVRTLSDGLQIISALGVDFVSNDVETLRFDDRSLAYGGQDVDLPETDTPVDPTDPEEPILGEDRIYQFALTGAQQSTPNGSSASGTGYGIFDASESKFTYTVTLEGLGRIGGGHIHAGARGVDGDIVLNLLRDDDFAFAVNADRSITAFGVWDADEGNAPYLEALGTTEPGDDVDLYFNVHTSSFPGGEIRGQIVSSADAGGNEVTGTAGADTLDGGAGADVLEGRGGNDVYVVDDEDDRVVEAVGAGTDTVRTSVDFAVGRQSLEILEATGTANVRLTGTGAAETFTGNDDANVLIGAGGSDTMTGGGGVDFFVLTGRDPSIVIEDFLDGDRLAIDDRLLGLGGDGIDVRAVTGREAQTLLRDGIAGYDARSGTLLLDIDGDGPNGLQGAATFGPGFVIKVDDVVLF